MAPIAAPQRSACCPSLVGRRLLHALSIAGLICGALCLLAGICLIFTSCLVSQTTDVLGIRIGAGICAFGVAFLLSCAVILYKWQTSLDRLTRNIIESTDTVRIETTGLNDKFWCEYPTYTSVGLQDYETFAPVLKKANSTAYISLGSSQPDKFKLVGLLHGTISATEICRPNGKWLDTLAPTHAEPKSLRPGKSRVGRDHSLRRSLPRILFRPPNEKAARTCERKLNSFVRLAKAGSEGRKLDELETPKVRKISQPSTETSPTTGGFQPSQLPMETTLASKASLFNLPGTLTNNFNPSVDGILASKIRPETSTGLERSSSGKRFLLMNQTGQVISCTTLFDDAEQEDDQQNGTGCRHLQACGGWNIFPVFVESDDWNTGAVSDDEDKTNPCSVSRSDSQRLRSCITPISTTKPTEQVPRRPFRPVHSLFSHLRRFVHHFIRATKPSDAQFDQREKEDAQSLLSKQAMECKSVPSPAACVKNLGETDSSNRKPNKLTFSQVHSEALTDETRSQSSNSKVSRKQTIVSNASVFSLPAVPPEMWSRDRPVWIMGVPVQDEQWLALDACDLILLQQQRQSDRAKSVDSVKPQAPTGSHSSVYAFHVRPPARLKSRPTNSHPLESHAPCSRARSLGRFLFTDKHNAPA